MKYRFNIALTACLILVTGWISSPALSQQLPEADQQDYHTGLQLYQEGLFENSMEYLTRFLEQHPDSPLDEHARYYLAMANIRLDTDNAENHLEQYIRLYPHGRRAAGLLKQWGNEKFKQGRYTEALVLYERALRRETGGEKRALLSYRKAEASSALGEYEDASSYYRRIAEQYPDSRLAPNALYARGRLYLHHEEYEKSTDAFELLRKSYPHHEMTRRIGTALGESYYQQGLYREAISSLQSALQYVDGEAESKAVFLIAESYNYLNELQRASAYYRRYINRHDSDEDARLAHYGLGWVYHKQQVYHWAAESFGKAVTGDDEISRKALYYKAINEKLGGRYDLAIQSFQKFGERYRDGLWVETAYYEWAVTAFEMGNNVKAIEVLQALIRSDTELESPGEVYTLLGEAYFANNEFTRAVQAFDHAEQLVEVDPAVRRQARFQRAWVQYQNQAYRDAQSTFQELYEEKPDDTLSGEALFWSADCYYNLNNWSRASAQFERFLREFPGHELAGAARYSLGWSYFKAGQYDRAVDPLVDFLENYDPPPIALYPYDIDTKLRIADALYATREYRRAIRYYEEAVGAEPGGDYALFQIGNSYFRNDQSFEAVSTFRRLIRIYPFSNLREQAQYNVGYIYFLTGNYSQAVEEFRSLINRFPGSSWAARAQYNIGDAYYNAGFFEEAINAYKRVLELYPRSEYIIEAINGIQFAQLSSGMDDTSSEVLEEFLSRHPHSGIADRLRYRQAEYLLQAGNHEEAIASLRQYLRITNSERLIPEAHFNIAESYEYLGDTEAAKEEYQLIINEYPDSERTNEAIFNLAHIYFNDQEFETAILAFESLAGRSRALRLEALAGAGNAYIELGRPSTAREKFTEALNQNPDHEESQIGLGRAALAERSYDEAEQIFREIIRRGSTGSGAQAQYFIGFIHQQKSNYNEALRAYSNVRILFEGYDEWVAKSMLRSAECHRALGARNEAENILRRLREQFPDSEAALQAAALLEG